MECVVCYAELVNGQWLMVNGQWSKETPICTCRICKNCFYEHCIHLARNAPVSEFTCPGCSLPDVYANPDEALEYFGYLSVQIKAVHLDDPLTKLIETKILDWKVKQLPDFYKCAHCELGFKFESGDSPSMTCTFCSNRTCYYCKTKYEAGHQCEGDDNCDAIPTIECPRCHQVYEHVASDCLHSVCLDKECLHEFCSSCQQPYYKPIENTDLQEKHGYACDHSRNCLSKLRNYEVEDLLGLLQENEIEIDTDVMAQNGKCTFIIDGYLGSRACGQPSGDHEYCMKHYKDHLIRQINAAGIDPAAALMTIEAMKEELRSKEKELPQLTGDEEEDMRILRAAVQQLPLTKITEQSVEISCDPVDLIECSKCGGKYEIARGACIHFTCPNCKHEFCGTCLVPFIRDPVRGLTCKHTRNCLASLRDYDIDELLNLAQENEVDVQLEVKGKTCILKITDDSYKEMECGKDCHENYAYCLQHFKEHVISKINSNHIDPINILDEQALKMELRNSCNEAAVKDGMSRAEMVKIIKEKVPLKKMGKPKLKVTSKNLRKVGSTIKSAQQKEREKSEGMLEVMGTRTTVCPQCKSKHEDMWNGSLRYTCYLCDIDYCSFCSKLFTATQSSCSQNCEKLGNHCHHPENCFYYLRDCEVEDLQKSLKDHNVQVPSRERVGRACRTVIEHDIKDHTKVIMCQKKSFAGETCVEHYKETLARLIYKHDIIPVLSETHHSSIEELMKLRTAVTSEHPSLFAAALYDLDIEVDEETPRTLPPQSNQRGNQSERLSNATTPPDTLPDTLPDNQFDTLPDTVLDTIFGALISRSIAALMIHEDDCQCERAERADVPPNSCDNDETCVIQ